MSGLTILSYFLAPAISLILLVYLKLRLKIKTNKYLYQAFLFGLISVIIVIIGQLLMDATGINYLKNIKRTAFFAMVIIAFGSELGKFIILRYIFFVKKSFYGPVDGIIYSVFIGLGFATATTVLLGFKLISSEVDYLYLFTNAPANIIFAVILGFFVGLGKTRENRFIDSMTGLFAATIFHGLYTFSFLTKDPRLLLLFAIGSVIIIILLVIKALSTKIYDNPDRN
jgi:RsiW-degrading membrane proteinase PrsW (M82 family)